MTLMALEFMRPERLWAMITVPALIGAYVALVWFRGTRNRRRPGSSLDLVIPRQAAWRRHAAVLAAILSLASLVIAWAMPRGFTEVPRDRATVVVVIDVSKSMLADDVKPSRLGGAQEAAKQFTGMLPPRFNVALVSFAGTATLLVPPTTDRGIVSRAVDQLQLAPSTAMGEGIYSALDAVDLAPPDPSDPDKVAPAAIVLLSDGESNLGRDSAKAAQAAKAKGVPVFTIAYGTTTGYIVDRGQRVYVPVNHAELKRIADLSGGQKFSAASADELKSVYEGIARSIGYEKVQTEVTEKYAGYALLFGILAAFGAVALGSRWT